MFEYFSRTMKKVIFDVCGLKYRIYCIIILAIIIITIIILTTL